MQCAARLVCVVGVAFWLVWLAGCSRFPAPPKAPEMNASDAGRQAITQYDANGDGRIDGQEVKKCPALAAAFSRVDADADGALTAAEIADRVASWFKAGAIVTSGTVFVRLDGQPLEGATVTFEPEPFLGPAFRSCSGVTGPTGAAYVTGSTDGHPGIYLGFYRVRISKQQGGKEILPARYNTESELGCEVANDIPGLGTINFDLKSK